MGDIQEEKIKMETPETQPAAEISLPVWKTPTIVKIELRRTLGDTGSNLDGLGGTVTA